ncbi:hypothetical protein BV898_03069 [Hypsibius exemplaris]|uniref:Guanylate cyclase domain-containing protein n=1 Tax=Hypsibius exemplaris TaxID=2072580 RepID=A0A1W0X6M9_HYPEX|nr:hypothetical protein BV898_03069 [Hypsibius exemplaris]
MVSRAGHFRFGDTVIVASQMESTGEAAMKIQITEETNELLQNIGGYRIVERGSVPVKGKGMLTTYWLLGGDWRAEDARIRFRRVLTSR